MKKKETSYDLSLPLWGTYNKVYSGFSRILDFDRGITFDVDFFPGFYRRSIMVPSAIADSGAKAIAGAADFSHVVYRYELEWKDKIYCDLHLFQKDGEAKFKLEFVNNTELPQSLQANMAMSLRAATLNREPLSRVTAIIPDGCTVINAADYDNIGIKPYAAKDGLKLGEAIIDGFTESRGLSAEHFKSEGDWVEYELSDADISSVGLRYMCANNSRIILSVDGEIRDLNLPESPVPIYRSFYVGLHGAKKLKLINCGIPVSVDLICLGKNADKLVTEVSSCSEEPKLGVSAGELRLKYPSVPDEIKIRVDTDDYIVRTFICDDIGKSLTDMLHRHVPVNFDLGGSSHFTDLFIRPLFLSPYEKRVITIEIATEDFIDIPENSEVFSFKPNKSGERYLLSQNIMAAVTMTNTVFPIYCRGEYIRYNSPGRIWDSLYTWDGGFIGLGLLAIDKTRGYECLRNHLTPAGDLHSPFILHGSPVATQAFLYQQFISETTDLDAAKRLYPQMKQYYDYFPALRNEENGLRSGLLKTWHLFYNSGGWDDYPPQKAVHSRKLEDRVTPIITTAVTIIFARIMRQAAALLGYIEDIEKYDADIEFFKNALQPAWDNEVGYFSYVIHDESGNINGFLRTDDGVNLNMGFDGIYPYVSRSATAEQYSVMLEHIKNDLLTDHGVSVVAVNAPYFTSSGYWNGSVWMPHQWILWKALLDHGEVDLADKIAHIALELWKKEVDATYNCYEHFMLSNGRGAGFHQFSGLSTPVMLWYKAYHISGSVTAGFSATIYKKITNNDCTYIEAEAIGEEDTAIFIVCLSDKHSYIFAGAEEQTNLFGGTYRIKVKKSNGIFSFKSSVCGDGI